MKKLELIAIQKLQELLVRAYDRTSTKNADRMNVEAPFIRADLKEASDIADALLEANEEPEKVIKATSTISE